MKPFRPYLITLLFLLGAITRLHAASVQWEINPRTVQVGQPAEATFTVQDDAAAQPPDFVPIPHVQVYGPNKSFRMQILNGQQSSAISYSYTLIPLQSGAYSIGPFQYQAAGKTFDLPAIELIATDPNNPSSTGSNPSNTNTQDPSQQTAPIFARLTAPRTQIYHQEFFDIDLAIIYHDLNIHREVRLGNLPTSGLTLSQDLIHELAPGTEEINGQLYRVRRFRFKVQALTQGTFTIQPTIQVQILSYGQQRRQTVWDNLFQTVQAETRLLAVDPLPITVLPIPEKNRPSDFTGAVGAFNLNVQVQPTQVNVGDPITITMEITGSGNIDTVTPPTLQLGTQFKSYEARLTDRQFDQGRIQGRKLFEQVILPASEQSKEIPPITFSYFDPTTGEYRTLSQGPFPLTVTPSTNQTSHVVQGSTASSRTDVQLLGTDIAYIKPAPRQWLLQNPTPTHPLRPLLLTLPALTVILSFLIARQRRHLRQNVAMARRHKALKSALTSLQRATQAVEKADRSATLNALWYTLETYFTHRLNLAPGQINPETVLAPFQAAGLDQPSALHLEQLFTLCEQQRFGLGAQSSSPLTTDEKTRFTQHLQQLNLILKRCEKIRL